MLIKAKSFYLHNISLCLRIWYTNTVLVLFYMKFNKEEDLGIAIITYIAKNKEKIISANNIASEINISLPFTKKIMYKLKRSKIIKSIEGKNGGYVLNIDPRILSLKDILESISGSLSQVQCFNGSCPIENKCLSKLTLNKINNDFVNKLSQVKISSII